MRLLAGLVALIALFAFLVRVLPAPWALPLYILFVILTVALTGWERRRIAARRQQLERELHKERLDFSRRRQELQRERDKSG